MKYDLEKNKRRLIGLMPNNTNVIILFLSLIFGALSYDLQYLMLGYVSGGFFLMELCYCILWFIDVIIYIIIYKKRNGTFKDCLKDDYEEKRVE